MTEQLKRGRGPGRPVLANLRNAGPLLGPHETTHVHRVRADAEVNAWFAAMTAAQRGDVLARARVAEAGAFAGSGVGAPGKPVVGLRPAQSLAGVTSLVVMDPHVPQRMRNGLRWAPDRYVALETLLAEAGRLDLHRTNGKDAWRTPEGQTVRRDTVARLYGAGVLVRVE